MKAGTLFLAVVSIAILWSCNQRVKVNRGQSVNAILGDVSFADKHGIQPNRATDEDLRIRTHLEYVEKQLRNADITASSYLKAKRQHMLDLLHTYWNAGVFPRNYDYLDQRKPCFIDQDGRICAVGYLIEQTMGREVAEAINEKFQYEEILAMDDPLVDRWIAQSGLTKMECAMIQPSYGGITVINANDNHVSKGYGISSALLSGANASLSTINGVQIGKGTAHNAVPWVGLATGAAQVTLGIVKYPETEMNDYNQPYSNVGQRNVSLLNVGLGAATMILSSWNLIANAPKREKALRWGFQRIQVPDGRDGLGIHVAKRF